MVDHVHFATMRLPATFSLPVLEHELHELSMQIDSEPDDDNGIRRIELCAAYRALKWARNPDGYAPPSER